MGLCQCKTLARHARLVNAVYPSDTSSAVPVRSRVVQVTLYAMQYPHKLQGVVGCLQRRLLEDLRAGRYGHAEVSLRTLDELIQACHSEMSYFVLNVMSMINVLLQTDRPLLWIVASNTFRHFVDFQDGYYRTLVNHLKNFLDRFTEIATPPDQTQDVLIASINGVRAVFRMANVIDSEIAGYLKRILPALLTHTTMITDLADTEADEASDEVSETALDCLREIASRTNATTIDVGTLLFQPLFKYFDDNSKWDDDFAYRLVLLVSTSLQESHLPPKYLLQHAFETRKSNEEKSNILRAAYEVVRNDRVDVGPDVSGRLKSLRKQLLNEDQVDLQEEIIGLMGLYARRVSDITQRTDALENISTDLTKYRDDAESLLLLLRAIKCVAGAIDSLPAGRPTRDLMGALISLQDHTSAEARLLSLGVLSHLMGLAVADQKPGVMPRDIIGEKLYSIMYRSLWKHITATGNGPDNCNEIGQVLSLLVDMYGTKELGRGIPFVCSWGQHSKCGEMDSVFRTYLRKAVDVLNDCVELGDYLNKLDGKPNSEEVLKFVRKTTQLSEKSKEQLSTPPEYADVEEQVEPIQIIVSTPNIRPVPSSLARLESHISNRYSSVRSSGAWMLTRKGTKLKDSKSMGAAVLKSALSDHVAHAGSIPTVLLMQHRPFDAVQDEAENKAARMRGEYKMALTVNEDEPGWKLESSISGEAKNIPPVSSNTPLESVLGIRLPDFSAVDKRQEGKTLRVVYS